MGFWRNGFVERIKSNVFKWWQLVVKPTKNIDNNTPMNNQQMNYGTMNYGTMNQSAYVPQNVNYNMTLQQLPQEVVADLPEDVREQLANTEVPEGVDPMEVLRRINEEREEKRRRDIEEAKKKAIQDEKRAKEAALEEEKRAREAAKKVAEAEAKAAAIMNANKVDMSAMIAEAEVLVKEKEAEEQALAEKRAQEQARRNAEAEAKVAAIMNEKSMNVQAMINEAHTTKVKVTDAKEEEERIAAIMNANKVDVSAMIAEAKEHIVEEPKNTSSAEDDALRRAQEIMDRLNREAAEDEAKKNAEIEAVKQQALETFGN